MMTTTTNHRYPAVRAAALSVAAALAVLALLAPGCAPPTAKASEVEVVYYYLPG